MEKPVPLTFIVRLWREKADGESVWRGSVDCAQNGERLYFQNVEKLNEAIFQLTKKTLAGSRSDDERE